MDWTEICVTVDAADTDRAADIASMAAKGGIYIEDYRTLEEETREIAHIDLIDEALLQKDRAKALIHLYVSPQESPAEAVAYLDERLAAADIPHTVDTKACRSEDWENNWKAYFHPLPVGRRLLIQPLWREEAENPEGRAVLRLEPGLAFGTGAHQTTRLCLEALETAVTPGSTVLDVGCGSGILAIAARLLGAKTAVGVDIDALAVKTARENGRRNGFSQPGLTFLQGNLADDVTGQYDVVVTNIVADVILLFLRDVGKFMKPGSVFIASGIIDLREQEVLSAMAACGFTVEQRAKDAGWVCLTCKKAAD